MCLRLSHAMNQGIWMLLANLPQGTTHVSALNVTVRTGGMCFDSFYCFKYVNQVLMVYVTDSDNEYPQWIPATNRFNKPPLVKRISKK